MVEADWLSELLRVMPITGSLDIRCNYAGPWKITYDASDRGVMRYHMVLNGSAMLIDQGGAHAVQLSPGDVVIFPGGAAHTLYAGNGAQAPLPVQRSHGAVVISEILGPGELLDMVCGRFMVSEPHDRIVQRYFPKRIIVSSSTSGREGRALFAERQLSHLMCLIRAETEAAGLGGRAMLNALSAALFTSCLRLASEDRELSKGVIAVAGQPELAPALVAMLGLPGRQWTLPKLAGLCNMSRATFIRRFQERLGGSASGFLRDVRMSLAGDELRKTGLSIELVAETVGYKSVAAFQRAFKESVGMTPSQWRKGVLNERTD